MEGAPAARTYLVWSPAERVDKPDFHIFDALGTLVIDR